MQSQTFKLLCDDSIDWAGDYEISGNLMRHKSNESLTNTMHPMPKNINKQKISMLKKTLEEKLQPLDKPRLSEALTRLKLVSQGYKMAKNEFIIVIDTHYEMLKEYPTELVVDAVNRWIKTKSPCYMPAVADLIAVIHPKAHELKKVQKRLESIMLVENISDVALDVP